MTQLEQLDRDLVLNIRQRALLERDLAAIEDRIDRIMVDKQNLEMSEFDVDEVATVV